MRRGRIGRKTTRPSLVFGVGSVAGTLVIGSAMLVWFFLDVFLIG